MENYKTHYRDWYAMCRTKGDVLATTKKRNLT